MVAVRETERVTGMGEGTVEKSQFTTLHPSRRFKFCCSCAAIHS